VIIPPHKAVAIMYIFSLGDIGLIIKIIRSIPYPPSFSRTAARIIEPATGASTWALGNHRWKKNNGSFTIKAKFIIIHGADIEAVIGNITINGLYE
jgi:hypothetical protein